MPPDLRQKAIVWGTVGAILVRSDMTVGVVWLLKILGLMLIGGLALVWIAFNLINDNKNELHDGPVIGSSFVLKLVERFPLIIKLDAAVLAFTAAKMIVSEPLASGR